MYGAHLCVALLRHRARTRMSLIAKWFKPPLPTLPHDILTVTKKTGETNSPVFLFIRTA